MTFIRTLMAERGLPFIAVRPALKSKPSGERGARGGLSSIGTTIQALQTGSDFPFHSVERLMVWADNDRDPNQNFKDVLKQLKRRFPDRTMPQNPLEVIAGHPSLRVAMLPLNGDQGNLECCCVPAADSAANAVTKNAVSTFITALPNAVRQDAARVGKLRLRGLISAQAQNPFISFKQTLEDAPHLINWSHKSLTPIANVLKDFVT